MSWMTGLNATALSLQVGLDDLFFPLLILQLVAGSLARRLLQAGIPTGWRLDTLRVAIFFLIAFMPALQNTKGRMVGYKDHKTYGDSSIYENTPSDTSKFFLQVSGNNS